MVCVHLWYKDTDGSVKRRYWQQVWQLHVKGVAMVTGHSQLSHPLPSSLCVSLSLTFLPPLLVISSHTSGQLYFTVVALCCSWQRHHSKTFTASRRLSLAHKQQKISIPILGENTHLQESDTGNGIMPSYPDSSFPQSTIIGEEEKKKKAWAGPELIITSWQEKLSCSVAEQGSYVSLTQMSHCFMFPCLTCWGHQVPAC